MTTANTPKNILSSVFNSGSSPPSFLYPHRPPTTLMVARASIGVIGSPMRNRSKGRSRWEEQTLTLSS
ncbi:hypothetical protein Sjap_015077 [Stephania japonica]|uniref:Uncharacterized protein n=1 Tax=Stephania japonica TaxID=461633 RepID=A0AAP0IJ83_9MAGN